MDSTNKPATVHTPEAIAIGAQMLAQAQGDIATARRACGNAYAWLASLPQATPPSQIPQLALASEVAPQPASDDGEVAKLRADLAESQRLYATVQAERNQAFRDLSDLRESAQTERGAVAAQHANEVAALRAKIARLVGLDDTPAPQPAPAPVKVASPVVAVPAQTATPAPVNGAAVSPAVAKWMAANGAKG